MSTATTELEENKERKGTVYTLTQHYKQFHTHILPSLNSQTKTPGYYVMKPKADPYTYVCTGEQEEVEEEEGEIQVISLDGVHDDDHGIEIVDSSDSEDEEEEEEDMSAASIEVSQNTRERERENS